MLPLIPPNSGIFIAVSFPASKGRSYPLAVALARQADVYREGGAGKELVHVAGYRGDPQAILRAICLIEHAAPIRACLVSNGSSVWGPRRSLRVLRCYLAALSCPNPAAYCRVPYESTFCVYHLGAIPALLPCRLVDGYFIKNWHRTGTIAEQLQAAAVEAGCEWCPLWSPVLEELKEAAPILDHFTP